MSAADRVLLLQPPYGDYTYPYHSLSYVAAALDAAGVATDVLDLNALWFRSVFTAAKIGRWRGELTTTLDQLQAGSALGPTEQQQVVGALKGLALCDAIDPNYAIETLRSDRFYDWAAYQDARRQVRLFEALLSILYAPYDFLTAFSLPPHEGNLGQLVGRADALSRWRADLADLLRPLAGNCYLFCGVTAPFSANLAPGLCLLDAVADVFPGLKRVLGGTAAVDLYKYRRPDLDLRPLGRFCDGLYVGEAEPGMPALVRWVKEGGAPPTQVLVPAAPDPAEPPAAPYVALSGRAQEPFAPFDWTSYAPRYDWVDWSLYLAPEARVNYAPIRGCFWNRCTFCDYGLNSDAPTAPYRAMDAGLAAAHLAALVGAGVRRVYLAADALSPHFLQQFAQALIDRQILVDWACQLYLTPALDGDLVELLARSGLRTASFGLESGSAAVLDRMGKGSDRVRRVLEPSYAAFRRSQVGLQPLFFFGFPGETDEDRQRTVDMLLGNADIFTTISRGGQFELLAGSQIAKRPQEFGVRDLSRPDDDDISGVLDYEEERPGRRMACAAAAPFNRQLPHVASFERPWAGGIDTLHTQLYIERFGREVFHQLSGRTPTGDPDLIRVDIWSPFDLDGAFETVLILDALEDSAAPARLSTLGAQDLELGLAAVKTPLPRRDVSVLYSLRIQPFREL